MGFLIRRLVVLAISATLLFLAFRQLTSEGDFPAPTGFPGGSIQQPVKWKDIPPRYPVSSTISLPSGSPTPIPRIQHDFGVETVHNKEQRLQRQAAVKESFLHSWKGYKKYAWLQDEVTPVTGGFKNGFGARAATLVDTLDTLMIMGLDEEFEAAVKAVKQIDFTTFAESTLNLFETNIRYLGGLLSAYDVSGAKHHILLEKAVELGDMLYKAFDTPNRLPITRWDWQNGALEGKQEAPNNALSAEIGSLSLEFTRLSQLTKDPKYYDAIQRITDKLDAQQNKTGIPGLFPILFDPLRDDFSSNNMFTFGGMADSLYEYFPKEYLLLGGLVDQYKKLYEGAIDAAKQHLFFRPLNPQNQDILVSGSVRKSSLGRIVLEPEGQHLTCFTGGMVGMGAKIFNRTDDLAIARKLVDGCIWAYDSMPTGIMPETFRVIPCKTEEECTWDAERWHKAVLDAGIEESQKGMDIPDIIQESGLQPGFAQIADKRFLLRPEAIESVFIMYRITGDTSLQDAAWRMFTAIQNATTTEFSHSAIADVTSPEGQETQKLDECESFWMAETLKYFYLIFSDPHVMSLDEYVFNTEAHPLRRPQGKVA